MRMPRYDPIRRRMLAAEDVQQLDAIGPMAGYVPTRGRDPGAPWFVWLAWTNESRRIEDLPPSLRDDVRLVVHAADVSERLLQRCDDVRGLDLVPAMSESHAALALHDARDLHERDWPAVDAAIAAARKRGFKTSEIAIALERLEDAPALSDALDGVEVVSVKQIAESMRARPG